MVFFCIPNKTQFYGKTNVTEKNQFVVTTDSYSKGNEGKDNRL